MSHVRSRSDLLSEGVGFGIHSTLRSCLEQGSWSSNHQVREQCSDKRRYKVVERPYTRLMVVNAKLNQQIHTILWLKKEYRLGICHGWFHLYWLIRAVSHLKKAKITKWKKNILPTVGLEFTISRLLDWHSNRLCYRIGYSAPYWFHL